MLIKDVDIRLKTIDFITAEVWTTVGYPQAQYLHFYVDKPCKDKIEDVNIVACFICQETNPVNEHVFETAGYKEFSVVTATTVKPATISNRSKKASHRGRAV